jgi:hypothetical protein
MANRYPTMEILVNGARGTRRRGPGMCKACNRKIFWVATARKKAMPFDDVPEVIALNGDLETVSTAGVHWSTCPNSKDFKPKKTEAARPAQPASSADWSRNCPNCGQTPVVEETGLCGPCTFGEAETADGNW